MIDATPFVYLTRDGRNDGSIEAILHKFVGCILAVHHLVGHVTALDEGILEHVDDDEWTITLVDEDNPDDPDLAVTISIDNVTRITYL